MEVDFMLTPIVALLLLSVEIITGLVFGILISLGYKPNENQYYQRRADSASWRHFLFLFLATPIALLEAFFIHNHIARVSLLIVGFILVGAMLSQQIKMIYYTLHR